MLVNHGSHESIVKFVLQHYTLHMTGVKDVLMQLNMKTLSHIIKIHLGFHEPTILLGKAYTHKNKKTIIPLKKSVLESLRQMQYQSHIKDIISI